MDYEVGVKHFFSSLGYHIEKIPESSEESPDFFVYDDTASYVIELKTKLPSPEQIAKRKAVLEAGEIHSTQESITYKNRLHGIIKKATSQLGKHKDKASFRLIWLLSTGHLAEPLAFQFISTLYGLTNVIDITHGRAGDCYFFYNSDFYRYKDKIDSAIISTEDTNPTLLLNPLSVRYKSLKNSSLIKHFADAVVDPFELDSQGRAFLVESDVDRSDNKAILNYLSTKYKSDNFIELPMNYFSGTLKI
jgi:hypothetical protein